MIYTVTLNPAIDYVVSLSKLKTGNINRSLNETVFFGGKGINVSLILNELGIKSTATGFIAGFTGNAIKEGLNSKGIYTDFVDLKSGLTRINVKIREETETDINGKGPEIGEEDIARLFEKLSRLKQGDILVLSGSVPGTLPADIYGQIMKSLKGKGIGFVVDAEKDLLLGSLKYTPFLVKPNSEELGEIFGVRIDSERDAFKYAKKLKEQGAVNVLVSMGAKGAALLDEQSKEHFMKAVSSKAVNTTGAGDSMVAGFIAGFSESGDYDYALSLGTAAGSATAFSEGLATKEQIYTLLNKLK